MTQVIEVTKEQATIIQAALHEREYIREYGKAYRQAGKGRERVVRLMPNVEPFEGEFAEWLTLFWEGDGSIGPQTGMVVFYQKEAQILEYIRGMTNAGNLYPYHTDGHSGWQLSFDGMGAAKLVKTFINYVSCPFRLEQLKPFGGTVLHKPTKYGFTGFWDAEGNSSQVVNATVGLMITVGQKEAEILYALAELWQCGNVYPKSKSGSALEFSGEPAWEVGAWLLKTSHNDKKRQTLHERMYAIQEYNKQNSRKRYLV